MGLVDLSSLSAVKFHPDPEQKQDIELRADQFTCLVPPSQSILRITRDKMIINTPVQEGV
uniref:Uncharacterized protein n=1 Tax=Oryza rufipogon TaxID=4529 RepID=A0A0E0QX83_ORYRU